MNIASVASLVGGLLVLTGGAELLVRASTRLAAALGVSPLIVGLTVVAFGTSAPELVVSVTSALDGRGDIAFGNAIGSNVFNILFILGISAAITPLVVAQKLVRVDVPIMVGVAVLAGLLAFDGHLGRGDGLVLVAGLAAFLVFCIRSARSESAAVQAEQEAELGRPAAAMARGYLRHTAGILGGLALLVGGSKLFVGGAVELARALGVSDLVIGLTIVAAGTSLPEVATSILAAIRGERDIAVGNVVGSNIFNLLGVLGVASTVAPGGITVPESALHFDVPVMIAASIACLPIFFTGFAIARWEGLVLLGYYVAYALFLVLDSSQHDALPHFSWILSSFALPLTALGLGVGVWRSLRRARGARRIGLVVFLAIGLCLVGLLLLCTHPPRPSRAWQAADPVATDALTGGAPLSRSPAPSEERNAPRGPPPTRPAQDGQVIGRVRMHLPCIPSDLLRRISSSRTPDECSALLTELEPTVVGRLPVQLRGDTLHDQVLTDEQGYFRFDSLAPGTYELSAELLLTKPCTGESALLRAFSQVHLETGAEAARIDLGLRESLVTIRGRVLDSLGAPIAGVTVEGRAVPIERHDLPNDDVDSPFTVRAETDSNGEYVLPGFPPLSFFHAACFLLGVCNEAGMEHVDICVPDPRFEITNATRVILMTEALSHAAAPLAETLRALPASVKFPTRKPGADASKVKLHSSQSNEILGVDIVADPRR